MRINCVQNLIDRIRGKKKKFIPSDINYIDIETEFQDLICITGFGHSGSGTILDLLCECNNTTVLGYHDMDETLHGYNVEINLLRAPDGIMDLASAFKCKNSHIRAHKINRFISLIEALYNSSEIYGDNFIYLSDQFIDNLVYIKMENNQDNNTKLKYLFSNNKNAVFYLKNLTEDEYIEYARDYLNSVFKSFVSKKYLVLDQFVSISSVNFELQKKYIGDFKNIAVYRDPRDVYATGIKMNLSWMPRNVDDFIKWYRYHVDDYFTAKDDSYLLLRFEDIVLNYEKEIKKVFDFVGIKPEQHVNQKKFFNPKLSQKNIGFYKKTISIEDADKIKVSLQEYCYK